MQGNIALVAEREGEGDSFVSHFRRDEDGVGCAALGGRELIAALFRVQGRAVDRRGDDLRIICAFAFQAEFVEQLTVLQLIVFDGQVHALVRFAEDVLSRD